MTIYALSTRNEVIIALVAGAWIVVSLLVSMVIPRSRPDFPGKGLNTFLAIAVVFFAGMLTTVFVFAKEAKKSEASAAPAASTQAGGGGTVDLAAGKAVWDKAACGGCHTLKAAGGTGHVGPDLDQLKPDEATVEHQVINGGGAMPAFKGILTPDQIKAVASYVAAEAGK